MVEKIILTFIFEDDCPSIDAPLQIIKIKVFDEVALHVYNKLDWAL